MAQFTNEELEQIRQEDEKSDLRQFLKGCYTKIQDGLRKLDERSASETIYTIPYSCIMLNYTRNGHYVEMEYSLDILYRPDSIYRHL